MKRLIALTLATLALSAAAQTTSTSVKKETSRDSDGSLHRSTTTQQQMEDDRMARPIGTEAPGPKRTKTTTTTRRGTMDSESVDDSGSTIED